jgi:hypothetical protein
MHTPGSAEPTSTNTSTQKRNKRTPMSKEQVLSHFMAELKKSLEETPPTPCVDADPLKQGWQHMNEARGWK